MNVSQRVKNNEKIQNIKNFYQYGNINFLEAVRAIMNKFLSGEIAGDEAELAIKQISRIRLPH